MTIPFTDDHANYIMRLQERISELEQRLEYNQNYTKALITENNEVIKQLAERDTQLKVAQEGVEYLRSVVVAEQNHIRLFKEANYKTACQRDVALEALRKIKSAGPLDHHSNLTGVAAEAISKIEVDDV